MCGSDSIILWNFWKVLQWIFVDRSTVWPFELLVFGNLYLELQMSDFSIFGCVRKTHL